VWYASPVARRLQGNRRARVRRPTPLTLGHEQMRILKLMILLGALVSLDTQGETNEAVWPKRTDIPRFSPDMLSTTALAAAHSFSAKRGTNRIDEAWILDHALAPAASMTEETDPKWLMNENDVVQLLGEPDVRKANMALTYHIGHRERRGWSMFIKLKNGFVHSIFMGSEG
jgi:hypothetical protein